MTEENSETVAPEVQTPPASLRLETTPYQPDGGYGPLGVALLLGLLVVAGLIMGWLASLIGQYFYLILIFPLVIGVVLGAVGAFGTNVGKVRSPLLGGIAGFFGGCVAMTSLQYFDYQRFLSQMQQQQAMLKDKDKQIIANLVNAKQMPPGNAPNPEELRKFQEDIRRAVQALQVKTYFQYIDFAAKQGVKIGRRGGGINLGYYGTYIYWLAEILIVAFIAFYLVRSAASEPFCRQCQSWKDNRQIGTFLKPDVPAVQAAVEEGTVGSLLDYEPAPDGGPTVLSVAVCPNCGTAAPIDVKLELITKNKKDQETKQELAHITYPGEALPVMEAIFARQEKAHEDALQQ